MSDRLTEQEKAANRRKWWGLTDTAIAPHSHPCIECHEPTPCTSQRDHRTPMCEACKADDADVWGRTSV